MLFGSIEHLSAKSAEVQSGMLIQDVSAYELAEGNRSPIFAFRRDQLTCKRLYSSAWEDCGELVEALRGTTYIDETGTYFNRNPPHQFWWQNLVRPLTCLDVSEAKGAGFPRTNAGAIDTSVTQSSTLVYDADQVGHADRAHLVAEYAAAPYAIIPDDDVNDPLTNDLSLSYCEWDRYTEWDTDFSAQLTNLPQGAYKYFTTKQPVNIPLRIPISEAKITAKIYHLPIIPPAALFYNGAVNENEFSFYLQPVDGPSNIFFTCEPETLLFLYAKSEKRRSPIGENYQDVTLHFSYRKYGHNTTPLYSPSSKRVNFERIAADVATLTDAKRDNSAMFRLRNFGYFWSPKVPELT